MKYSLNNDNLEIVGKQYLQGVGNYTGNTLDDVTDVATIINDKVNKADIVTPDWNAQESEAGYIENRTHYKELDLLTKPTSGLTTIKKPTNENLSGEWEFYVDDWMFYPENYEDGFNSINTIEIIYQNNTYEVTELSYTDTGIRMKFKQTNLDFGNLSYIYDIVDNKVTLTCYGDTEFVPESIQSFSYHTLNEAYIPDTIARKSDIPTNIIKTTPQTLSDTAKNQTLTNLGIQDKIDKIDKLVNTTYEELKSLRDNSQLIPGQQYRITDYTTTTVQENTRIAEEYHPFDIIVIADDVNVLNENARAIQHEGDTYFTNSDLNAWELKYCLDNDTDRFIWADDSTDENDDFVGKGVIYRMIDEFGNDCPYDFKNIQFKHPKDTKTYPDYYYTFTLILSGVVNDYSLDGDYCYGNTMCRYVNMKKQLVNGNVFINKLTYKCHSNTFGNNCRLNAFGSSCSSNTFGSSCHSNTFGNGCYSNNFGDNCQNNTFGENCYSNTFGNNCRLNTFGENCSSNTFGNGCYSNTFGNGCYSNTFGYDCHSNTFDYNCPSNTFGNGCYSNTFGYDCYPNNFGIDCSSNTFGSDCHSNTFGNGCYSNNFGDNCRNNSFGNSCYSNDFGNNCRNNSFSDNCYQNLLGNGSYGNSFKNNCYDNSFGIGCGYNSFGNSCKFICFGESTNNIKSYYRYITFDNGNSYINLNCTSTTSSSNYYQNVRIGLGVNNMDTDTYKTINDSNVGQTYQTLYKPTDSKELTA